MEKELYGMEINKSVISTLEEKVDSNFSIKINYVQLTLPIEYFGISNSENNKNTYRFQNKTRPQYEFSKLLFKDEEFIDDWTSLITFLCILESFCKNLLSKDTEYGPGKYIAKLVSKNHKIFLQFTGVYKDPEYTLYLEKVEVMILYSKLKKVFNECRVL